MTDLISHRIFSYHSFMLISDPAKVVFGNLLHSSQGEDSASARTVENVDLERTATRETVSWIPPRMVPAVRNRYADEHIFEKCRLNQGDDLYLPVKRLVSGEIDDSCRIYKLSDRCLDMLNDGRLYEKDVDPGQRYSHQLALLLSGSALRRINSSISDESSRENVNELSLKDKRGNSKNLIVPVKINRIIVYHFSTGRTLCQVELHAANLAAMPVSASVLQELVDHISRFATLVWIEKPPRAKDRGSVDGFNAKHWRTVDIKEMTLGSVVASLVNGVDAKFQRSYRTFTHTYAQVDISPRDFATSDTGFAGDRLRTLAITLARQYNTDYRLQTKSIQADVIEDFENVIHATVREGSATVVGIDSNSDRIEFLDNYLSKALIPTYLPILVLNLHQLSQCLDLSARSLLKTENPEKLLEKLSKSDTHVSAVEELLQDWTSLQQSLALLNGRFRFHQISPISPHNRFNQALRNTFGLDELEKTLREDLSEMSSSLQSATAIEARRREAVFHKDFRVIKIFAGGVLASLVALELISAWSLIYDDENLDPYEYFFLGLAVIAFAFGAAFSYRAQRDLGKD